MIKNSFFLEMIKYSWWNPNFNKVKGPCLPTKIRQRHLYLINHESFTTNFSKKKWSQWAVKLHIPHTSWENIYLIIKRSSYSRTIFKKKKLAKVHLARPKTRKMKFHFHLWMKFLVKQQRKKKTLLFYVHLGNFSLFFSIPR